MNTLIKKFCLHDFRSESLMIYQKCAYYHVIIMRVNLKRKGLDPLLILFVHAFALFWLFRCVFDISSVCQWLVCGR